MNGDQHNQFHHREPYYLELFSNFGLKPQESKIYLACLRLGQGNVGEISKLAQIQRTFAYDVLKNLKNRGIVSEVNIDGKKKFRAISIEGFRFLQKEKLGRLEAFLPELKQFEKSPLKPNVRFFEGRDGIIAVLEDTLNQPPNSEILCYSNVEGFYTKEHEFEHWYVKERVKLKINMRFIGPDNEETKHYVKKDKQHKRVSRVIPEELFPFAAEVDIYGNKVAILTLGKEMVGMIIESEDIAKTQRFIFELAWRGAKQIKRKV